MQEQASRNERTDTFVKELLSKGIDEDSYQALVEVLNDTEYSSFAGDDLLLERLADRGEIRPTERMQEEAATTTHRSFGHSRRHTQHDQRKFQAIIARQLMIIDGTSERYLQRLAERAALLEERGREMDEMIETLTKQMEQFKDVEEKKVDGYEEPRRPEEKRRLPHHGPEHMTALKHNADEHENVQGLAGIFFGDVDKERRKMDSVKILLSEENQDKPVDEGVEDELAKINAALEAERKRVTDLDQKARDLEQEMKDLQSQRRRGLSSIKRKELEARGFNDKALFELIAANDEHALVTDELSNIFIWIDLWKWRCEYLARGKRLNEMYLREKERKKTMRRSSSLINLSSLDGGHPSPSWCSCCGAAFSRSLSATSMSALHPASGGNAMCTTPLQHMTFRMAMARDASSSGGSTGSAGSLGERRKKKKPRFHLH